MTNNGLLSDLDVNLAKIDQEAFQLTGSDAQKSAWELADLDTGTTALARMASLQIQKFETRDEPKLQPEELNKRYPDIQQKFDEPMNLFVANEIANRQKERQELQKRVNAGPQDGWYGFTNKYGANLLAHATDPLELGLGFVTGAALPARVAAGTLGRTFLEGALGNLAVEPVLALANKQEHLDYDVENALVGAIGTAGGFTVLHGAIKLGNGGLNRFLGRVSPKHTEAIQNAAMSQVLEGKKIDVGPVVREIVGDTNIPKTDFVRLADDAIPNTTFYSPKEQVTTDVNSKSAVISDDYGQGIYLTDDQVVANNAAARKLSDNDGSVVSGKVEANLADLDNPNPKFNEAVEAALGDSKAKVDLEASGKEIFEQIHDHIENGSLPKDFLNKLQVEAQARGLDGYRFTVDKLGGLDHSPHNAAMIFDGNKFKKSENLIPDNSALPRVSKEDVQSHFEKNQSQEASIHYDSQKTPDFEKIISTPPQEPKLAEWKKSLDTLREDLDSQIEQLGDHPYARELTKLKEELTLEAKKLEVRSTVIKAAGDCLGR